MEYIIHVDDTGRMTHITRNGAELHPLKDEMEVDTIFYALKEHITWIRVHGASEKAFSAYHEALFAEYLAKRNHAQPE